MSTDHERAVNLLPCPFCGATNVGPDANQSQITCCKCFANGPWKDALPDCDPAEAIVAWNSRVEAPTLPDVAALQTDNTRLRDDLRLAEESEADTRFAAIASSREAGVPAESEESVADVIDGLCDALRETRAERDALRAACEAINGAAEEMLRTGSKYSLMEQHALATVSAALAKGGGGDG